jgi:hypothetical protein
MASDLDHEVMPNGMTVSLKKLLRFHKEAKRVDLKEIRDRLTDFVSKHEPNKNCKEQLDAARDEASAFSNAHPDYFDDEHNFNLLHDLSHKYFLSEKKMDRLMEHFMKIGLLY